MTRFPQYAKSTDPEVLGAIRRNKVGEEEHHQKCLAFALANGVEKGEYYKNDWGSRSLRAVGGDTKPTTGRWKKGPGGYGWVPYKNNPLHEEFEDLFFRRERIPGHVDSYMSGSYYVTPIVFEFDGAVWSGATRAPDDDRGNKPLSEEGGWVEVKASEFHAAMEGYNELHFPKKDEDV
jgi:hypothetical protein